MRGLLQVPTKQELSLSACKTVDRDGIELTVGGVELHLAAEKIRAIIIAGDFDQV